MRPDIIIAGNKESKANCCLALCVGTRLSRALSLSGSAGALKRHPKSKKYSNSALGCFWQQVTRCPPDSGLTTKRMSSANSCGGLSWDWSKSSTNREPSCFLSFVSATAPTCPLSQDQRHSLQGPA